MFVCPRSRLPRFRRLLVAMAMSVFGVFGLLGNVANAGGTTITNITQLQDLADSERPLEGTVNLEGIVLWSSEAEGCVVLQDDSGVAYLELDLPAPMPRRCDRLNLVGNCTVVKTADVIKLSGIPVVENDGLHIATEKSGSIYVKAGLQPIRVAWFNRTDKYALDVSYAGPDLPRQKIPDSVLFRAEINPVTGTTNFVNGLDFRCCEGLWWGVLPNLYHLPAVKVGAANNFDLDVKSRSEHVGLQFSGYIKIPKDGEYMFYTSSDDGSRLFLGEPSLKAKTLGKGVLPKPRVLIDGSTHLEAGGYVWSEIEGTVTSVNRLQGRLEIELATGIGRLRVKVANDSDCSFILTPQNRIRMVGVCRNLLDLDGAKVPGEFFVQDWSDIEQLYISPALWAAYPLLTIRQAKAVNMPSNSQPVVHLRGKMIYAAAGGLAYLEDGSGQVALSTDQGNPPAGFVSDALGRLQEEGTNRILRCAFIRHLGEMANGTAVRSVLTTAEQVHQLNGGELNRDYPVKLRGVITSVMPGDLVVLQDTTRGIVVSIGKPIPFQVGDYCEVEGTAKAGEFSPYIAASRIGSRGIGEMPNPVLPTWDQLLNGSLQNQYVELEGVITRIDGDTITLLTRDGAINVGLEAQAPALPRSFMNALVRMRGCLFVSWDSKTHRVNVGKINFNQQWVDVVQPAPIDPFVLPVKRVGDLLKFDPQAGALQRVKVLGQIIYQTDSSGFLMDGENGLRFNYAGKPTAHVCDMVEVVGFPDLSGPSPVLRDAEVQRKGPAEFPKPRRLDSRQLVRDEYDSILVQVEGVLLGLSSTPDGIALEMQNGLHRFMAVVKDRSGLDDSLIPGSRLELTGVYVGQGGNRVLGQPIDSFRILLNTGFDIKILSRPPWWTLGRLLMVVGVLAGILFGALIWIRQLHRKVEQRTQQLEVQIRERQRAERQNEMEQERSRVARDLHDDLGAGLTRVNMLSTLVSNPAVTIEARTQYLSDLKELARNMVTSLDEIVWAVNPRNDTVASLVGYFGAHTQQILALASIKLGLDVDAELPDFPVDAKFRHEILMAFKEAITNVIRHSGATKAWLRIHIENDTLILEVEDNGRGLDLKGNQAGADGLANMKDRLSALGGRCQIQSEPGKGATIRFEAPLPKIPPSL